jgi:hypothetical protein
MARYFTQGTFTTETNYADSVRKAMVSGFTSAIAAGKTTWSIVDDGYVNSTSERTVFSCSSGTGFSIMIVNHSTSTTNHILNSYIGKDYNLGTHTLNKIGFGGGPASGTVTAGADAYSSTNYNPTTTQTAATPASSTSYNNLDMPSTISNWFIVVEDDYAVFSIKDGTAGIGITFYFGAIESAITNSSLTDNAPYGLFQNAINSNISTGAIILHSLNNANKNIQHFGVRLAYTEYTGRPASATKYDVYKTGTKSVLSKINIFRQNNILNNVNNPNSDGHHRGTLKGVVYAVNTGAAWGDQIDVDGVTYLYSGGITSGISSGSPQSWWVAIN